MTEPTTINPHVWRKFSQAQDRFRDRLGFRTVDGTWKFNGNRVPKKMHRRQRKWAHQMKRWIDKLF